MPDFEQIRARSTQVSGGPSQCLSCKISSTESTRRRGAECRLSAVNRTPVRTRHHPGCDPDVWSSRPVQEVRRSGRCGLATMYPVSDWSSWWLPTTIMDQRACDLISGQASNRAIWVILHLRQSDG